MLQHVCAGELVKPRCTLSYAAPEVVAACEEPSDIVAAPAQDIWALGVMAFEAVNGRRAIDSTPELFQCAAGSKLYPWDTAKLDTAPPQWRKSRLRPVIQACLARDPALRLTAAAVVSRVEHLWVQTSL